MSPSDLAGASPSSKGDTVMADDNNANDAQAYEQQPPEPSPDLMVLDKLIGTWKDSDALTRVSSWVWDSLYSSA
jgi:hypothetical protein